MTWAILGGFLIGSIPTADLIGRLKGVNLRKAGTGNPGTANALGLVGRGAAITILLLDVVKGAGAAALGFSQVGDATAAAAAVAAVVGQVMNPWFGFRGGKGLGVAAGATLAIWPLGLAMVIPIIALGAVTIRAAWGAVFGILGLFALSMFWAKQGGPTLWGITADDTLVWFTIGVGVITLPKFVDDLRHPG